VVAIHGHCGDFRVDGGNVFDADRRPHPLLSFL